MKFTGPTGTKTWGSIKKIAIMDNYLKTSSFVRYQAKYYSDKFDLLGQISQIKRPVRLCTFQNLDRKVEKYWRQGL